MVRIGRDPSVVGVEDSAEHRAKRWDRQAVRAERLIEDLEPRHRVDGTGIAVDYGKVMYDVAPAPDCRLHRRRMPRLVGRLV